VAIRYGGIDKHDPRTGQCLGHFSSAEPIVMELGGQTIEITTCPRLVIPDDIWIALDYVELAEKGHWPIAGGGVLDQAQWFMTACRFVWNEIALWKIKFNG
jgi:hypothetical protein